MHSTQKEKHNFEEHFFFIFLKKKFIYEGVLCYVVGIFYKNFQNYFLFQICIPHIKENIGLKKFFGKFFCENFIYEGVLCLVFYLNEDTIFYWNIQIILSTV